MRAKRHKLANADIRIGTMVLIKETNMKPLQWNMGRVTTLKSGQDGVTVVAVEVNTRGGIRKGQLVHYPDKINIPTNLYIYVKK